MPSLAVVKVHASLSFSAFNHFLSTEGHGVYSFVCFIAELVLELFPFIGVFEFPIFFIFYFCLSISVSLVFTVGIHLFLFFLSVRLILDKCDFNVSSYFSSGLLMKMKEKVLALSSPNFCFQSGT